MGKTFKDMNVREMLKGLLTLQKAKGLKNTALDCSCPIKDLISCDSDPSECIADHGEFDVDKSEDNVVRFKK